MAFSPAQQKALAIAPMTAAPLSMIGSCCIIKAILKDKSKLSTTYHRILFAMSVLDFTASFAHGLSTLPIPRGTPGVWGASGNVATCTAQAFFGHPLSWMTALNASLAIYYLLVSRYNWTEDRIRKLQPLMIGLPLTVGYGSSIACVALDLFNNANLWCWIAPYPEGCKDSFRYGNEANCIRGDNAYIYRYAFTYGPMWTSIFVATVSMIMVYVTVLQQEKEVDKFQENGVSIRTQSKRIFWQGFWYIIAFYITWIPSTLVRLLQSLPYTKGKVYFPLILTMAFTIPLQGFWNFLVFSRARYHKYRRENGLASKLESVKVAAFSVYPSKMIDLSDDVGIPTDSTSMNDVKTEAMLQSEVVPQESTIHK